MAVLTRDEVKAQVVKILPIEYTELYSDQLDILVGGAISKLSNEGVDINATDKQGNYIFDSGSNIASDYIICVGYQLMKDMDYDVDMDFMTEQYITRIGTLRCSISVKQR